MTDEPKDKMLFQLPEAAPFDEPEDAIFRAMGAYDNLGRHIIMGNRGALTKSQADVLMGLLVFGTMNMTRMSEHLAVSKEQASRAVAPLVEKGYVQRKRNPDNFRAIDISLTEKGMQHITESQQHANQAMREKLSCLSDEDRATLLEASRTAEEILRKVR